MAYKLYHVDCFDWLGNQAPNSIHAVITDPPFGLIEYTPEHLEKRRAGKGGIWRIPPSFDGTNRKPLPRFTVLTAEERGNLYNFFRAWGQALLPVLVPGAHLFVAANTLLSQVVWTALIEAGFEKRGEIVRLVRTFRGGDRPKGAEEEFDDVCSMPRSNWEPWGLFRKPFEGRLADNLRLWKTGALRRISAEMPFPDVIESGRTPKYERDIAPHPSLKPQAFLRQLVWASLPLGKGVILDPFAGSGSTLAACQAVGYNSIGVEVDESFYRMAEMAIPQLASLLVRQEDRIVVERAKNNGASKEQMSLFEDRAQNNEV